MNFWLRTLIFVTVVGAQINLSLKRQNQPPARKEGRSLIRRDRDHTRPIDLRHDSDLGLYCGNRKLIQHIDDTPVVTAFVGTPGQSLDLQIRSDQALSWFPSSNSTYCIEDVYRTCASHGSFNQGLSSTFRITPQTFERQQALANGTIQVIAKGYGFNDTLVVGDVGVDNLTMGISYESGPFNSGVLGLGYGGSEADLPEENLATQLVAKGLIPTAAYSIWLNDENATSGSLLFGAIDKAKYEGDLIIIDSFNSTAFSLMVYLSSVEATSPSGTDVFQSPSSQFPVGFAIGVASTSLPSPLAQHMWAVASAEYWSNLSIPVIPCALRDSAGSYRFRLGGVQGPIIEVPLKKFAWPPDRSASYFEESGVTVGGNETMCLFTILNTSNPSNYFIGEDFMQAAYFSVDLYNEEIAMAPAKYNTNDTDIVTFVAHGAEAPSATYARSQPTEKPSSIARTTSFPAFTPSATYSAAAGFASLTNTATTPTQTAESHNVLSTGAKAGIGVGVPLAVILVGGIIAFAFWRRKRGQPPPYTPEPLPAETEPEPKTPRSPASELPVSEPRSISELSPSLVSPLAEMSGEPAAKA
ncbi:aspartic peptidase domain-containing protein [Xylariaceae sp. FL0662B]|nr:aspartic peptidase domain-containing protein [Xylariaceae sp. FL0662B]